MLTHSLESYGSFLNSTNPTLDSSYLEINVFFNCIENMKSAVHCTKPLEAAYLSVSRKLLIGTLYPNTHVDTTDYGTIHLNLGVLPFPSKSPKFECNETHFGYDTAILAQSASFACAFTHFLHRHLAELEDWYNKWEIAINPTKTEAVFSTGNNTRRPAPVHVQNHPVPWSKTVKYLGVIYLLPKLKSINAECEDCKIASHDSSNYFLSITDDYSRKVTVIPIKRKSDVFNCFTGYQKRAERFLNNKVVNVRIDNGLEFIPKEFCKFLDSQGIEMERTNTYSPEMNGKDKYSGSVPKGESSTSEYNNHEARHVEVVIPRNFKEVSLSADKDKWFVAMKEEINIMSERCVWELVLRPEKESY
ncbi:copia protein [Trichonephila clavipes]|nr:copia protein [Trichonephila clavipes]